MTTITGTSMPTVDPTTDDPTTVGPLDTTAEVTTMEVTVTAGSSSTGIDPCDETCMGLACGTQEMCSCGDCSVEAVCSDDQTYCGLPIGEYGPLPDQAPVGGSLQLGFRYEVFQDRIVRRLGVNAYGAGSDVRLALYDDDGFGPDNLLQQTGAVTLYANGANEWEVGATPISAGLYWVMLHTEGSTPLRRTLDGDMGYQLALRSGVPFGAGFPPVMNDEMIIADYQYNLYMIVED